MHFEIVLWSSLLLPFSSESSLDIDRMEKDAKKLILLFINILDQFLVFKMCKNNDTLVFDQFYQMRDCNIRFMFNELIINYDTD